MGAEQSTESRNPNESAQPLPPEPPPPEMVPTSNLHMTSAAAIDAHRPTAMIATAPDASARVNEGRGRGLSPRARGRGRGHADSVQATTVTQDAALAEPSPPQDSIRKLTYRQLLARALTMKGQHIAEVERLRATAQEELRAQRAEFERVREQLVRANVEANARVVEAEQALAARVDAGTASQREQKAAAAKKAANEKAAAAKKAVDEKAAADKAAAEKAAAAKKAADEKAAAEKAAAEEAAAKKAAAEKAVAAIKAVDAKAAADKAAADSKREKAVVDLRLRLATAFATVAPGPAEEAHKRSEELRRRIDTHWALLWSRVDLGYALRNLSPLRLQAEPTAVAMLGDELKPDLEVLVGVYLKFSARADAHGEAHGEGVVLNSWSDLVVKEARWADYEVARRIFHCVLDGRTRLDNVASPLARKLGDPRAHPGLLGLHLSLPEFLQALVLLAVDRKIAVRTSSAAAVADDALDAVGDAVAGDMVPVIKPTRAGSGSVRWQPTTDDWAEPRTPQRVSLSVHDLITADDLITAVKQTVSELTAASTNVDTPNLDHVLTCRERWVSDASSAGLRLHAVRRLLEPMLLHLFNKLAAHGEGGGSAPLSSPLAVFEHLVDSARFASSTRKLEPRLVYLCAAALHDRAEPHPLDQPVGPVLTEAVVRYACRNGADERCGLDSLALTCAQLLAPWLVPTSESDLPGLREQLKLVLAAKSPRSAMITRGEDHALGRADKPGRVQSSMTKRTGPGDCVPSWIPQPVRKGEACVWVLGPHRDDSSPMYEIRPADNVRDIDVVTGRPCKTWPYHEEDFEKADMCEMLNIDEPNILSSELLQP